MNQKSDPLHQFFTQFTAITYSPKEIIITAGEPPAGIYYIESGTVQMNYFTLDGQELTLTLFKPCSFFPMNWALNNTPNTYQFQAFTKTKIWRAPAEQIINFLQQHPLSPD